MGALTFLLYAPNLFVRFFHIEPRLTCNQKEAVSGGSGLAVVTQAMEVFAKGCQRGHCNKPVAYHVADIPGARERIWKPQQRLAPSRHPCKQRPVVLCRG